MKSFKEICKELSNCLSNKLNNIPYNGDLSDIGNEIGIVVAKYVEESKIEHEELENFVSGVRHGISLVDGTHDIPETYVKKVRLTIKERLDWVRENKGYVLPSGAKIPEDLCLFITKHPSYWVDDNALHKYLDGFSVPKTKNDTAE